jgi:2-polyprenyl-3-methyl-5-hydroxy-6-metoxy-1,4-benzoquinol methylase
MKKVAREVFGLGIAVSRRLIPLTARRHIVAWIGGHEAFPYREKLAIELLRDFAERDPNAYHRFLWARHLAYAQTFRAERRFGEERIHQSRRMLFDDLRVFLQEQGIDPETDIRSVLEVGSSLGYLLHHLETGMFRSAISLEGIDIDRHAIDEGAAYLGSIGSSVTLTLADMSELEAVLAGRKVDVILCAGVLMYVPEDDARAIVRSIMRHTGIVAAFAGLAHPERDNSSIVYSAIRERDATFIHNLDGMVRDAGGHVAWRRWEGPRDVDGNTIYFVFGRPGTAA